MSYTKHYTRILYYLTQFRLQMIKGGPMCLLKNRSKTIYPLTSVCHICLIPHYGLLLFPNSKEINIC